MSAFAGIVRLDNGPVHDDRASRLAAALEGCGFASPARIYRGEAAAFAFRRRLVLPEDGLDQPPHLDRARGIVSLFDGRLDNRDTLLAACGADGAAALSDGAVALHAYRRWGADAPSRLLGDFAWVVWDEAEQRLVLTRDHSIHRALFYFRTDGLVAFATTYRGLFALPEVPRVLDEDSIVDVIATSPDTSDRSLYKDVRWVRPAEMVVLTRAGTRQSRCWQPTRDPAPPPRSDARILDEAKALFDQAVSCRDRSIGPPVILMSGGLDSAGLAATMAARRAPGTVHGLTLVPADVVPDRDDSINYRDERPLVAAIAARYPNLQIDYLASTAVEDFENDPSSMFLAAGAPLRGSANTAWFHRAWRRAEALGAPVLLSGGFGNMTFSADGISRLGDLLAAGFGSGFLGEFLTMRRHMVPAAWRSVGQQLLGARLPWLRDAKRRLAGQDWATAWRRRTALNPDFQNNSTFQRHYAENAVVELQRFAAGGRERELRYVLERSRMQVESRAAVRTVTGIDMWDPYADRRIIDFCLSLPADQFLRQGVTRSLARRLFADRLPASVLSNPRRGEQNADWYLRLPQLRQELEHVLEQLDRSVLASRILDLPRLKRMLRNMPADPDDLRRTGNAYKVMFSRAVHVGRFLAWYERAN